MSKKRLMKALEIPEDIGAGAVKLSVLDFKRIRIDNYRSLVEYEREVIRINTAEKLVRIEGKNFTISSVTDEYVEIEGEISCVCFE